MSEPLYLHINKLKASVERLNKVSDQATEAARLVEAFLTSSGISYFASVPVELTARDEQNSQRTVYLASDRLKDVMRLWVNEGPNQDAEGKAWSDCTRSIKLQTITKLPDLLQILISYIDEDIKAAAIAEKAVESVAILVAKGAK